MDIISPPSDRRGHKEGIGLEAFRLLAPADWQAEGGVRWVLNPNVGSNVEWRRIERSR